MGWMPRRVRDDPKAIEAYLIPHEGVPTWLRAPLESWARSNFPDDDRALELVRYFVSSHRIAGFHDPGYPAGAIEALFKVCESDDELLLDLVDFQLGLQQIFHWQDRSALATHLMIAGSVFEIGGRDDSFYLQRRVAEQDKQAFELATAGDHAAAHHLKESWQAAFSRSPDSAAAYGAALRAVEAALAPLAVPRDGSATLGKLINALDIAPSQPPIELRMRPESLTRKPADPVEVIVGLLRLLQQGQRSRHGSDGIGPPTRNSLGQAQDAVMIAVLLVNLCRTGGITRRDTD